MRRLSVIAFALVVFAVAGLAAQQKKYGTGLTLTEVTKISEIYANPEKFDGKRVQVEGPVVDVCIDMGCWLVLGSDKASQTLRFKVVDDVIAFPMSVRGKKARVEGVVVVVKGTPTWIQIKGEGAVVF
jgi:hypothetical protein